MTKKSIRKDFFTEYDVYVFDLDGTLYFQKPFRISMLIYLLTCGVTHPGKIREFFLLKEFRSVRERWDECISDDIGKQLDRELSLEDLQYAYVAKKKKVGTQRVKDAVQLFMMEVPLGILPRFRDEITCNWIQRLRESGKKVIVYSDYPVKDKLDCFGIMVDGMYTSSDEKIGCMKPDPKGLQVIMKEWDVDKDRIVMIGDRYEKDGLAAEKNGIDYLILSSKKKARIQLDQFLKG